MLFGNKYNLDDFKKFMVDNGIVGTTAGVIIALSSKDLISSLSSDIIIPCIILLLYWLNIKSLKNYLPSGKTKLDLENFFKNILSWIIVVVLTFVFIKITFHYLLGIEKKPDVAKANAKEKK